MLRAIMRVSVDFYALSCYSQRAAPGCRRQSEGVDREMLSKVTSELEHDSLNAARDAALEDAAQSGGRVFPVSVSQQGGRLMLTTAFPLAFIAKNVKIDSAVKGGSPRANVNRPVIPEHVRAIKKYLLENRSAYFLGAVAMNVRDMPQVHVARTNAGVRSGYLVIDDSTVFHVTDGQHRVGAIIGMPSLKIPGALDEDPTLASDALTVQINVEPNLERIHQDFADAAMTKQIPPSLLAAYNMREPINRVLNSVVKGSQLFAERIDETSKTLPKQSTSVFLLNQVRGMVKELLLGDYAVADVALAVQAGKRLASKERQDAFIKTTLELIETLTDVMEPWKEIASIPVHSDQANRIPTRRTEFLNMTATGLVLIGHAAYEINMLDLSDAERLAKYRELGTKIDWRRDAAFWDGTVLIPDPKRPGSKKILTNRGPVKLAQKKIAESLGIRQLSREAELITA